MAIFIAVVVTVIVVLGVELVLVALAYYAHKIEPNKLLHTQVVLPSGGLLTGEVRTLFLTDFHIPKMGQERLDRILLNCQKAVEEMCYDFISLGGDFLHKEDVGEPEIEMFFSFVQALSELGVPIVIVFGNHDFKQIGIPRLTDLADDLARLEHVTILRDSSLTLEPSDAQPNRITITGIIDFEEREPRYRNMRVTKKGGEEVYQSRKQYRLLAENTEGIALPDEGLATMVLLAHNPDGSYLSIAPHYDLILSGHTHGGQIFFAERLLRIFPPAAKYFAPFGSFGCWSGWKNLWGTTWLVVSRGLGGVPLRLGRPPEMMTIILRPK